jgi:hypothetical protein
VRRTTRPPWTLRTPLAFGLILLKNHLNLSKKFNDNEEF